MAELKKNKIHNPQFVSDDVPDNISSHDIGRLWLDKTNKRFVVGLPNDSGHGHTLGLLTELDKDNITQNTANTFFSEILDFYCFVEPQITGDKHFDVGYDFFTDIDFIENATQELADYYSFFYLEVESVNSLGYVRTIQTLSGNKFVRLANGTDTYIYNSQPRTVVNYSKVSLPQTVKAVLELKFDNKDVVDRGFILGSDNKTILIYGDPDGFFIDRHIKVKCVK
jgi:hypothetical protein